MKTKEEFQGMVEELTLQAKRLNDRANYEIGVIEGQILLLKALITEAAAAETPKPQEEPKRPEVVT